MFKSKQPDVTKTDTLIGEGTTFEGKITSQASIRIEGRVIGDIVCQGDLTVGEGAEIQSNVQARNITIAGQINGDVTAAHKLAITASGKLFGNATSDTFTIEEGGIFTGSSMMKQSESTSKKDSKSNKRSAAQADEVAL